MTATPDEATLEARCDQARRHAEDGELEAAERIFTELVELGDTPVRAQAAMGLAVVRDDLGDTAGAQDADRMAIATEHPDYAPRAAYHYGLCLARDGKTDQAREAWQRVLEFANPDYVPAAQLALGHLADDAGDNEAARTHWQAVIDGGDADYVPAAADALAGRLLEAGEAAEAQRLLDRAISVAPDAANLWTSLAIAHLEQALSYLGTAAQTTDPDTAPLAIELLARMLPLRGHAAAAARVWEHGLGHPDERIAEGVRDRLRRDFGIEDDAEDGTDDGADDRPRRPSWWEPYVETAVCQGTLPMLTGELFTAVEAMHAFAATPWARGSVKLKGELGEALKQTVRVPSQYTWGGDLHGDFRERLRAAMGSQAPVLPEDWPDEE